MTTLSPVTPSRYRRRHVNLRRPYPTATAGHEAGKSEREVRKVYPTKPRGRRTVEMVKKVQAPFCWSSVTA